MQPSGYIVCHPKNGSGCVSAISCPILPSGFLKDLDQMMDRENHSTINEKNAASDVAGLTLD